VTEKRGLLDTSVFVAIETGRPLEELPTEAAVSVITLGELHAGVLAAAESSARARRLATLAYAEANFEAIPIDERVAREWGRLVVDARDRNRRSPINDAWIAATAVVHGLVVVTQDSDYDGLDVPVLLV
jgi:predicted nucleic acid-binding protein